MKTGRRGVVSAERFAKSVDLHAERLSSVSELGALAAEALRLQPLPPSIKAGRSNLFVLGSAIEVPWSFSHIIRTPESPYTIGREQSSEASVSIDVGMGRSAFRLEAAMTNDMRRQHVDYRVVADGNGHIEFQSTNDLAEEELIRMFGTVVASMQNGSMSYQEGHLAQAYSAQADLFAITGNDENAEISRVLADGYLKSHRSRLGLDLTSDSIGA